MNSTASPNQLDSTATLKLTLSPLAESRVLLVIKLLETDPKRKLTAEELGQQVGISVTQFRADFKKHQDVPLEHYRIQQSLAAAHHLITTESLTVATAMKRTGFNHRSHFNRMFKKTYDKTPGQLREQCRLSKFSRSV